jgi:CubicO group peptidase (beta-lactamase class C family)
MYELFSTNRLYRVIFLVVLLLFTFTNLLSAANSQSLPEKFDEYLSACNTVKNFHGAVLVGRNGEILFTKGYGMANIELDVPNSPEMKFQIGSITKQFTATAIMQIAEKGLLSVDDPVSRYLPDYPAEIGGKVTIHHLLTHTSGIMNHTVLEDMIKMRSVAMNLDELIATFKDFPLEFEPGSKYSYSNSGYVLLGAIIENVTGVPYEEYIKNNILDPLGMKNSGYCHRDIILKNRACGYTENDQGAILNAGFVHMSLPYSAGALYSTVGDMFIWDRALYTEKVLSKASLEKMFTPFLDDYAYGWFVKEVKGRKLISHGGGIDGFTSVIQRWVDDDECIVVFSNNDAISTGKIAMDLKAILSGDPYDIPVIKTPIEMDVNIFADYAGVYKIGNNDYRAITIEDDKLYSQRTNRPLSRIYPEAEDKFYFGHDHTVTLVFVRDQNGKVRSHIVHQLAEDNEAIKMEGAEAEEAMATFKIIILDSTLLKKYIGMYDVNSQFKINVTYKEGKLFAQAFEYPDLEMQARSETEFVNRQLGIELSFEVAEDGTVAGLVLKYGNMEMRGTKIE